MENLAPVVLFVYNRVEHTKRTVEALKKNDLAEQSELFIYSDAAKKEEDAEKVHSVREYIRQIDGFKKINIVEREFNYGLAKSIVGGVTDVISKYGKVIVLEDDLVTNSGFLTYMNEGLEKYQNISQVYSISGYSYLGKEIANVDTYFLKLSSSWSWATWKDRWRQYDLSCKGWERLKKDRRLRKNFDYDYSYPFYSLLNRQMTDSKTNSWAIKWYWTVFMNGGLTLYPSIPLVKNDGFDGSGEHCSIGNKKRYDNVDGNSKKIVFEDSIIEKKEIRKEIAKSIRQKNVIGEKLQIVKDILG